MPRTNDTNPAEDKCHRLQNFEERKSKDTTLYISLSYTKYPGFKHLKAYRRSKKPCLTEIMKGKRLVIARKYHNLTEKDLEKWIFSDECHIYLFSTPNIQNDRIYSKLEDNVQPSEQVQFIPCVMPYSWH